MLKKEDYLMIDILHKRGVEQAELRAAEGDPYHQPCLKNIPFTSRKSGRPRTQPNNDKGHQGSGGLCGVL
jgi:hypothetical protein